MIDSQRVLILDDDEGNRRLLEIALRTGGFASDCAETGAKALELARQTTYAIMLLDVNLPDMSGLDVSEKIRSTNDEVVIIVATTDDDDVAEFFRSTRFFGMTTGIWGTSNVMTYIQGDVPIGDYDAARLANLGIGHGAIDWGGGYTYFDSKTGKAVSIERVRRIPEAV